MRDHGRAVRSRVGRTIRQLRLLRGWSQERLAERANLSPKHVGQIERGQVSVSLDNLVGLADGLAVSIAGLFVEPRGGRSAQAETYVITGDIVAQLEVVGTVVRRIKSPRARSDKRRSK